MTFPGAALQPFRLCCVRVERITGRGVGVSSKERDRNRERRLLGVRDFRLDEHQKRQGRGTGKR
jgi:hypothetical protein